VSVKFFGQFLIEQGEIDAGQLREALERMQSRNRSLGDLAVAEGLLAPRDAERINAAQREVDRAFGELAVSMGLLSAEEVVEKLLARQREQRLPLGEALVELGHLSVTRLGALLDRFKVDQSPYHTGQIPLPSELAGLRQAPLILDLLPRFCLRVARLHVKLGPARAQQIDPALLHRAALAVRGPQRLELGLAADGEIGAALASGISGVAREALDPGLLVDGLGEFLNVLAGTALSALDPEGALAQLEPVQAGVLPPLGHLFELVATGGRAALIARVSALG
jgi:hypothetical protein